MFLTFKIICLRTDGMAQAVECLPCKCKDLSSNPSTDKKKNKLKYYD
jgi:hypothetical protein